MVLSVSGLAGVTTVSAGDVGSIDGSAGSTCVGPRASSAAVTGGFSRTSVTLEDTWIALGGVRDLSRGAVAKPGTAPT